MRDDKANLDQNRSARQSAHQDRVQIVDLMHDLESALAAPSVTRIEAWTRRVADQLGKLQTALHASREEIHSNRGLFAEIVAECPWLLPRVEKLKPLYQKLEQQIVELQRELDPSNPNVDQLRHQLGQMLNSLRNVQATETELIFEAIGLDLGVGD